LFDPLQVATQNSGPFSEWGRTLALVNLNFNFYSKNPGQPLSCQVLATDS
jgi:hypothetical protein